MSKKKHPTHMDIPIHMGNNKSEQTLGDRKGQASLAGYSQWGHQESDTT